MKQLSEMNYEELLNLYRQGYRLPYISIQNLQTNLVLNPGFETEDPLDLTQPSNWAKYVSPTSTANFTYNKTSGRTGTHSVEINTVVGYAAWSSDYVPVTAGATYNVSGYIKTVSLTANPGAFININWFDSSNGYINSLPNETSKANGTTDWTQHIGGPFTAPSNAAFATVACSVLDNAVSSTGSASFDDVSLTVGTVGTTTTTTPFPTTTTTTPLPAITTGKKDYKWLAYLLIGGSVLYVIVKSSEDKEVYKEEPSGAKEVKEIKGQPVSLSMAETEYRMDEARKRSITRELELNRLPHNKS